MNLDLVYLKLHKLSPDEYVALKLIKDKQFEDLNVFDITVSYKRELINFLITNGYIMDIGSPIFWDYSKLLLTKKSYDLFKTNLAGFERLFNSYPAKVSNGAGGSRILRPINLDSKVAVNCKSVYKGLIKGKPELEDKIYNALLTMLEIEKNKLQFLVEFERWLKRGDYEKYFDIDGSVEINISSPKAI